MTPLITASLSVPPRLRQVDVSVAPGQRVALIGPNGSGKTTLLRALAGIEGDAVGTTIDGEALASAAPARRAELLGFLPASREVRWPIPVRDVIALGLVRRDDARVGELLALLQLADLAERPVDRLSTGERARALLGRALASHPRLLLLDEPLSNLDPAWALRTLDLLNEIARAGSSIVLALHDLSLLHRFDRVWMLDGGRLVADLTPSALLASPEFGEVFGVVPSATGWALRPQAGPRSSP